MADIPAATALDLTSLAQPLTETDFVNILRLLAGNLRGFVAPSVTLDQLAANQTLILERLNTMSGTQTQVAADTAQLLADVTQIKTAFAALQTANATLVKQVATLQAAVTAAGNAVPPALQAQVDAVHAFAQSTLTTPAAVTPATTTPGATTTPSGTGTAL